MIGSMLRSLMKKGRINTNRPAPRKVDTNPLYMEPKAMNTRFADASTLRSKSERKLRSMNA